MVISWQIIFFNANQRSAIWKLHMLWQDKQSLFENKKCDKTGKIVEKQIILNKLSCQKAHNKAKFACFLTLNLRKFRAEQSQNLPSLTHNFSHIYKGSYYH